MKLSAPGLWLDLAKALRHDLGFEYLDFLTAVDWKGQVDLTGFITDRNPNPFLPEGATPHAPADAPLPGYPYRDAFEVVLAATNLDKGMRIMARVEIPRSNPRVPSVTGVWKGADWQERETFDLMGIIFEGHPNLKKILTPEFIKGHPLRKDYVHVNDQYD